MIRHYKKLSTLLVISSLSLVAACSTPTTSAAQVNNEATQPPAERKVTFEDLYVEGDNSATFKNLEAHNFGKPFVEQADKEPYILALLAQYQYKASHEHDSKRQMFCTDLIKTIQTTGLEIIEPQKTYNNLEEFEEDTGCSSNIFEQEIRHGSKNYLMDTTSASGGVLMFSMNGYNYFVPQKQISNSTGKIQLNSIYRGTNSCETLERYPLHKSSYYTESYGYWAITPNYILDTSGLFLKIYSLDKANNYVCNFQYVKK